MPLSQYFQVRVVAQDQGFPPHTALSSVHVTVERNLNTPVFTDARVNVTIPESMPVGTAVTQLTATDGDGVSNQWIPLRFV